MNRLFKFAIGLAFAFAIAIATPVENKLGAQDVTITIAKTKPKDDVETKKPFKGKRPSVDVAILLDTSGSMSGLISQAKTQLWSIIQQFADAKKNGQTPSLRVSVFEYGNSRLPASEDYIRQVVQLTDDMDKVSEALFALKTNGGDEYCGAVIGEAIKRLDWSTETNAYKAIFIAGNEPFTQGPVNYHKTCKTAIESGIVVNTIHCGDYSTGVQGKWKHGAELAEGEFMNINQDRQLVHIEAPQDKIIIKLNDELNKTYLWYGEKNVRDGYAQNQVEQDKNAKKSMFGFFSRGKAKSSKAYGNFNRDLVDTMDENEGILDSVKPSALPSRMQKMSAAERVAHVKKMKTKRVEIQKKIVEASKAREDFVANQRKKMAGKEGQGNTLGDVINAAVSEQLRASGFDVKK